MSCSTLKITVVSSSAAKLFADDKLKINHPAIGKPIPQVMGQQFSMKIGTVDGTDAIVSMQLYAYGVIYTRTYKGVTVRLEIEPLDDTRGNFSLSRTMADGMENKWSKLIYEQGPDAILKKFIGSIIA